VFYRESAAEKATLVHRSLRRAVNMEGAIEGLYGLGKNKYPSETVIKNSNIKSQIVSNK
jgi:hypothetical protein